MPSQENYMAKNNPYPLISLAGAMKERFEKNADGISASHYQRKVRQSPNTQTTKQREHGDGNL